MNIDMQNGGQLIKHWECFKKKKLNYMRLIYYIFIILLFFNCTSEKSYIILNPSMKKIVNEFSKLNEATIGFRKLEDNTISLYVLTKGLNSCDFYYGTRIINKCKFHLFLKEGVKEKDVQNLVKLQQPSECILSIVNPDRIVAPDEVMLYEYELVDNKFVKVTPWNFK